MVRLVADNHDSSITPAVQIVELLRGGHPGDSTARQELCGLIERLDPGSRRVLRSDPSLARALWLLDLAHVRDRETRYVAARRRGQQVLAKMAIVSAVLAFLLILVLTLQTARREQDLVGSKMGEAMNMMLVPRHFLNGVGAVLFTPVTAPAIGGSVTPSTPDRAGTDVAPAFR